MLLTHCQGWEIPALFREARETAPEDAALLVCLFGGDRAACCTPGGVVVARDRGAAMIGLCSWSVEGEDRSGQPAIVGLWVRPTARRSAGGEGPGVAVRLVTEAVGALCWHPGPGQPRIRVDCVTRAGLAVARRLPAEVAAQLDVRDVSLDAAFAAR